MPISGVKIVSIAERFRFTADGTVQEVMEVQFVTPSGFRASVDIPKASYTAEEARKRVMALAEELEKTTHL